MMNYYILNADNPDTLATLVKKWMQDGWVCQGGVCVVLISPSSTRGSIFYYFQAMLIGG